MPDKPLAVISTHALREEGDRSATTSMAASSLFLPTPSARRATSANLNAIGTPEISTHALREEGDGYREANNGKRWKFLPTPSARRATPA